MNLVLSLLILLSIFLIYYIYKLIKHKFDTFSIENNVLQQSNVDGKYYFVHKEHGNMQIAADLFAKIDGLVSLFLPYLYSKYSNSENKRKKDIAKLLVSRYDTKSLRESSPLNIEKDTSYTINKGDIIAICIRSGINYGIHDFQIIMFVVLHELTHLAINAYDHPEEFWQVFKFILEEAEIGGFYTSQNYSRNPSEYCGINVHYNPRYDNSIESL